MRTEDQGMCRRVRLTVRLGPKAHPEKPESDKRTSQNSRFEDLEDGDKFVALALNSPSAIELLRKEVPNCSHPIAADGNSGLVLSEQQDSNQ